MNLQKVIETFEKGDKILQLQSGHSIRIEKIIHQEDGSTLVYGTEYLQGLISPREIGKTIMRYDSKDVFQGYEDLPIKKESSLAAQF